MNPQMYNRFANLFRGNLRSYGICDPKRPAGKQMETIKEEPEILNFMRHLDGEVGIGIVPIRDSGDCWWGAIDIDNHDNKSKDLNLVAFEQKIKAHGLPLQVCRSKSGGAHLYIFGREPLRADMLKAVLTRWMADLQFEGSDCIFPKQTKLSLDRDGGKPLGNWINLPYFGGDDTDRYAIEGGKKLSLEYFMDLAESNAVTQSELENFFGSEHSEAPPCIRRALKEGIGEGSRNEALFHVGIYNKKKNPENAREATHAMQTELFDDPLPFQEADKTIKSAIRRDYGFLCKKEPWKQWCDKDACRKVKFGISESEFETLIADTKLPLFSGLVKYLNTEPVIWEIRMNGVPITVTTEELADYRVMRLRAMEKLNMILPSKIKPSQWTDEILADLMKSVELEEAPMESSPIGVVRLRLHEFCKKADLQSDGMDVTDRDAMFRGVPVVQIHEGRKVIMFRSTDFEDYLKRTRTDIPRNKTLWHRANREMGVTFSRIRARGEQLSVWYINFTQIVEEAPTPLDFKTEF